MRSLKPWFRGETCAFHASLSLYVQGRGGSGGGGVCILGMRGGGGGLGEPQVCHLVFWSHALVCVLCLQAACDCGGMCVLLLALVSTHTAEPAPWCFAPLREPRQRCLGFCVPSSFRFWVVCCIDAYCRGPDAICAPQRAAVGPPTHFWGALLNPPPPGELNIRRALWASKRNPNRLWFARPGLYTWEPAAAIHSHSQTQP